MYIFQEEIKEYLESLMTPLAFYEYDNNQLIPLLVSDGFCRLMDLDRGQAISHLQGSVFEKIHPDDCGKIMAAVEAFVKKEAGYDIIYRSKYTFRDEYHYVHSFGTWQTMPDGAELMCVLYLDLSNCLDVSEQLTNSYNLFQEDRLYKDSLTKLPNFLYLKQIADEWIHTLRMHGKTPVVIFSDVYALKSYNNHYGFSEGDNLICLAASVLCDSFPGSLITRCTEDDFVMITDIDDRDKLGQLLKNANLEIKSKSYGDTFGLRSGICFVGQDQVFTDSLDCAKRALSRIQTDINQTYTFYSAKKEEAYWMSRYLIENLDLAMKENWIKVYYQGLFRVKTGKAAAVEALARWEDPKYALLSPTTFIHVLQKYHLLYKLDLYIFELVCRDFYARHENNIPIIPVSVNFSRQDFDYIDVLEEMNRLYFKYKLDTLVDKSYFIVEITEQDIATGTERFYEQLEKIREDGYEVWLDDFGSGYSAINMFSKFQFDLIKYDMDLLRHLNDNSGANRFVLKQLIIMARQMGIHTLIEGIETSEQLDFVKEIDCELAQGFYFHRPEPMDEMTYRVNNGEKYRPCESKTERDHYKQDWFSQTP